VNWRQYGLANFLWFSDIALMLLVPALWLEDRLLTSMAALAVLLPELAWNLDFLLRLLTGHSGIGLSSYMFDPHIAVAIRSVSLFHAWLPPLLVWMLYRMGYDDRALAWQTMLAIVVVPLSYLFSDPKTNVNWVYGLGDKPQSMIPQPAFVLLMIAAFPTLIYLPTHLLLRKLLPYAH